MAEQSTTNSIAASAYPASAEGQKNAQFSIGIDLGTTHCALSYVDAAASDDDEILRALVGQEGPRRGESGGTPAAAASSPPVIAVI